MDWNIINKSNSKEDWKKKRAKSFDLYMNPTLFMVFAILRIFWVICWEHWMGWMMK